MTKLLSLLNTLANFLENDLPYFLGRKDIFHETRLDEIHERLSDLENKLHLIERQNEIAKHRKD